MVDVAVLDDDVGPLWNMLLVQVPCQLLLLGVRPGATFLAEGAHDVVRARGFGRSCPFGPSLACQRVLRGLRLCVSIALRLCEQLLQL